MRTRLLLTGIAVTVGVALSAPGAALAEPYPLGAPDLAVSAATVSAGGSVELTGQGYGAEETVNIDVVYAAALGGPSSGLAHAAFALAPVASTQTDAEGNWSTTITLTQAGVATITATGAESGVSQTQTVRVLGELPLEDSEDSEDGGGLPITGPRLTTAIVLGTVTVIAGALLLWVPIAIRRRSRTSGPA
jgi:hypothetical protein